MYIYIYYSFQYLILIELNIKLTDEAFAYVTDNGVIKSWVKNRNRKTEENIGNVLDENIMLTPTPE